MTEPELADAIQLSEDTPIVVTTDNGELLWVTEEDGDSAEIAADGAEIVVVETDDGQQQIQLVTGDGGQLLTLPPELAERLKERLSDLVAGDGVQQLLLTADGEEEGGGELEEGGVELEEGVVELEEGVVELEDGAVELQYESGELQEEPGREMVTLQVESDREVEVAEVAADPLAADADDGAQEENYVEGGDEEMGDDEAMGDGEMENDEEIRDEEAIRANEEIGDDGEGVGDGLVNFMKVEEEPVMSDAENIEEEYVEEEIGEFLGDLGFTGPIDGFKVEQAQSADDIGAANKDTENTSPDWTESTVTSASGAELKIRLPTAAALSEAATAQSSQPRLIVIGPSTTTGPPIPPPQQQYKKKHRPDAEVWAARFRREASRGIARAVAAVRRAEDSDEDFDSEEDETPAPAPVPAGDKPKRGRGRPRKAGGFSCQLCPRRLETQAEFFQHLRDHYEKPGGEEGETPAAAGDTAEVSERLEPIAEQGGDGDGPSVLNVDIIASEVVEFGCEQCEKRFYAEDDLERHRKTHIREALAAEAESSEPESEEEQQEHEHETPMEDLVEGPENDECPDVLAQLAEESEPAVPVYDPADPVYDPAVPVYDPAVPVYDPVVPVYDPAVPVSDPAADQYEMKNLKQCDDCPKLFTTMPSLGNHRQRMHNVGGGSVSANNATKHEYECEDCHVTYTSHKIYERHKRLHENKAAGRLPHRCSECGASFLTSMLLAHHAQKEHPETCVRRRRPGDGPHRPNGRPPGSSNKDRQAVYNQIRELASGLFSCIVCSKEAKTKNQMFYHVSIKHKALEGHKCDSCDKAFFTETALRVHERTHTGERPYVCDFCNRRFRQQADLNSHVMSIHTMERPYRCRFCEKAFSRKYSLTIHMRCHTNERNYRCHVCNKGFRASTYLTGHMKIHTGERSHACPICHKTFRMRSDMKRHIFTHSRDRPHPRSLRALTVQVAGGEEDSGMMLLDPNQLCLQLVTGEDGESMVITEGDQTMVLDGSQTIIDEQTGQLMVPESAISELDETALASMYLMSDGQAGSLELS